MGRKLALSQDALNDAALDMYRALKALVLVHRQLDTIGVMPADKAIAYGQAEVAIAKAEART